MSVSTERRKYFKSEARSLLRYNYPKQVFMFCIIILLAFGLNAAKISIIKLFALEYSFFSAPVNMFFDLLTVFITLPLYIGIIYVNIKLFEGENVPVGGMFHYFSSSANLLDCYKFITATASRFIAFALPFLIAGALFPPLRDLFAMLFPADAIIETDIAMLCAGLIYLIALFICVMIFMRYFASVFVFVKNPCLSVREIFKKSAKLMKRRKFESLKLIFSFAFWILISHYLAGVLYIFFTLPYMMLCYASFLSFVLSEKGGGEFLTPAYDYININADTDIKTKTKIKTEPEQESETEADAETKIKIMGIKLRKIKRGEIFARFKNITKVSKKA